MFPSRSSSSREAGWVERGPVGQAELGNGTTTGGKDRRRYFFGPKNAIIPSRTVGWLLELPLPF